ncbi:stress-responsive transcription factor hsf1, partial [Ascosphaera atra]
ATANDLSYPVTSGGIPASYSAGLANSRAEIDRLIKMQAEQDRNVQNLTNLLQPLSPTGAIPGLTGQMPNGQMPQPPLDLDQLFNQDYFTDYASLDNSGIPTSRTSNAHGQPDGVQHPTANDTSDVDELFNFDAMGTPQLDHSYPAVSSSAQGPSPQPASKSPRTR